MYWRRSVLVVIWQRLGATADSRHFDSGVIVGAFATVTDVSANDYGEGSFTKGIYRLNSVGFDVG